MGLVGPTLPKMGASKNKILCFFAPIPRPHPSPPYMPKKYYLSPLSPAPQNNSSNTDKKTWLHILRPFFA